MGAGRLVLNTCPPRLHSVRSQSSETPASPRTQATQQLLAGVSHDSAPTAPLRSTPSRKKEGAGARLIKSWGFVSRATNHSGAWNSPTVLPEATDSGRKLDTRRTGEAPADFKSTGLPCAEEAATAVLPVSRSRRRAPPTPRPRHER